MELHPSLRNDYDPMFKQVTLKCKYRAPEPLTIKFVTDGQGYWPVKFANESTLYSDGWHGEHVLHTVWDTRQDGKIYECHTITQRGSTLGVLFTDMRHSALEGDLIIRLPNTRFESNHPVCICDSMSHSMWIMQTLSHSNNIFGGRPCCCRENVSVTMYKMIVYMFR